MSIFTGIINGAMALFSSKPEGINNVMTVAKGVGGWIDEQQFTNEERAAYNAEMVKSFAGFMQSTVDESTKRSESRRAIAQLVIKAELLFLFLSGVLFPFFREWSAYWFKIATHEPMSYLVLGVAGFFFGVHILRGMQSKPKG